MAEENQEVAPAQTTEPSHIEQRAMEQGWVPQDQWEGSQDEWRPAKEFVDRGELLSKISEQKRELRSMKSAFEEFGKHHARTRQIEYERALASLKAEKKEALIEGDVDAIIAIDEKIAETKEEQRQAPKQTPVVDTEPDQAFVTWTQRNGWYRTDKAMTLFADEAAREAVANGERDRVKILDIVDKAVKKEFAHKFVNPNRAKVSAVEGSTNKGAGRTESLDMSDSDKAIMNKILKSGAITKEKYLEEYKAVRAKGV